MRDKKNLKKELKYNKTIEQCARQFGLVGDPTRMKTCWLLCKHPELTVSEIADFLDVSISAVSHSLKKLRKQDLVKKRRDHKQVFYSLADTNFNSFLKKSLKN